MDSGSPSTVPNRWNYAQVKEISEKFLKKHYPGLKHPIFNKFEERARFTIAHEIGHAVMHKQIYEQFNIETKEDYRKF